MRDMDSRSYSGDEGGRGDRGDRGDYKKKGGAGGKRRPSFRRKRPPADLQFDYKNVMDLAAFLTEEGKIIPGRVSGLSAGQQRQLTLAVKRARHLAFISTVRRTMMGQLGRDY